jgi:uncharacterized protein YxeA
MKKIASILIILLILISIGWAYTEKTNISIKDYNNVLNKSDKSYLSNEANKSIRLIANYWGFDKIGAINIYTHDGYSITSGHDIFLKLSFIKYRKAPITHELTHAMANYMPSVNSGTAFFDEGIAGLMEELYGPKNNYMYIDEKTLKPLFSTLSKCIKNLHNPMKLSYLVESYDIFENIPDIPTKKEKLQRDKVYIEAGAFFLFLNNEYGMQKLRKFYFSNKSLDFKGAFGKSLDSLEGEWKKYYKIK